MSQNNPKLQHAIPHINVLPKPKPPKILAETPKQIKIHRSNRTTVNNVWDITIENGLLGFQSFY